MKGASSVSLWELLFCVALAERQSHAGGLEGWWLVDTDEDRQSAQDNWVSLARAKGFRCSACGTQAVYDERELYFRTGGCGRCTNVTSKDD